MKYSKSKYYLLIFSLFYLLLIGIMSFYFLQVWELKRKEIHSISHEKFDHIEGLLSFEKNEQKKDNIIYQSVIELLQKKTTIEEVKQKHASFFKQYNLDATKKVDSAFSNLGYKVALRIDVTDLILNTTKESILSEPITILETTNKVTKPYKLTTSEWEVEESSINKSDETCKDCPKDYKNHFTVIQVKSLEVLNFNIIALQELAPLLIGSLLICSFILILYYITYKTIRKKEQEVKMLHNMVDNVSHEFKLPIATLKYGCNNLKQEHNSPTIALIQRQIDRLDRLQNQLDGNIEQSFSSFSKKDLLLIISDLQERNKNIDLAVNWIGNNTLNLPQTEIETILLNLIENSIKYGGTKINCTIKQEKSKIGIKIEDNGIGIPKTEQNLIFQKFYRIIHNNIHNTVGLGIGLYQVNQIVEKHKGTIKIKSKLTEGTTFIITIPYA